MTSGIGDILESFEGPRTLWYFLTLLVFVVGVLVVASILSSLYGIHLVEEIGLSLAENPMTLLSLAGILALVALALSIISLLLKYSDHLF
ncbi:hypothetical protein [Halococcoides cellulosivorans]|uniref:Uncharacterized protein n=1 Tax=Halococcoides cellulosivorans TaxID=1679096 RepID=A0A2R4WYB2_9EURY|nr:hypothetical protein [Halococcoides cellulosivorans]AWB26511.1 hypothetical protein HARCEL1_01675 [Halococcoides cellulosivorans]